MELHEKGSIGDLSNYRIETAKSDLKAVAILMKEEEYRGVNNRAYYKGWDFFKDFGRKIAQAEEIRHASDYDDFYIATKEKAEEQIMTAKELIEQIEAYCLKHLKR